MTLTVPNGTCLAWNLSTHNRRKASNLLMISFNMADGLMAVYVFMTLAYHHVYHGDIAYIALQWKTSVMCKVAGVIFMSSISMSNFTTMLIALDRFLCIVYRKFQLFGFTKQQCIVALIASWFAGLLLPVLSALVSDNTITNSACILIGGSVNVGFSIAYSVTYMLVFACTICVYAIFAYNVNQSHKASKSEANIFQVMFRLGAVAVTNFLVSMTVTTLSLLAVVTYVPPSLEAMLAFLLFPLNSCLNPIINTVTTKQFIQQSNIFNVTVMCVKNCKHVCHKLMVWSKAICKYFLK